jgi:hypothetical protein
MSESREPLEPLESRSQRNVVLLLATAFVAIALGFLMGRVAGGEGAEPAALSATPAEAPAPAAPVASPGAVVDPAAPPPRTASVPARPTAGSSASRERLPAAQPVSRPAPQPVTVTIPAGTKIELQLAEGISSQTAAVGDTVFAEVSETIWVDGRAVIPAGSRAEGKVTEARPLRKIGGRGLLAMTFDEIHVPGDDAPITASWRREGKSETAKDAATIAAGAAVGAVAGNQAKDNDKGKVIGGLIGAGLGTLIASKTGGEPVELPAGSQLTLTLRDAVEVRLTS